MKLRRLILPVASAIFLAVSLYPLRHGRIKRDTVGPPVFARAVATVPALIRSLRPAYPFSVIPGGAYSERELSIQAKRDPLIGQHYADFRMQKVRLVALAEDRFEYVSYRKQGGIFWTRKRLRIPKGELILTDGVRLARARCGNLLSDSAPPATSASDEPTVDLSMPAMTPALLSDRRITFAPPPELPYAYGVVPPSDDLLLSAAPVLPMPKIPVGESSPPPAASLVADASGASAPSLVFPASRPEIGVILATPVPAQTPLPAVQPVSNIPEPGAFLACGLCALGFGIIWRYKKLK